MGKQQISMRQMGIDAKQINKAALEIVRKLHSNNHEAYLVGGAVRDLLFGLKPKDFDVATSARPEQIRRIFRRSWIIGRRFRLVHVRIKNELVEVATFRTLPSKKNIAATGQLVIDNNFGDDAQEDALRRDLTVNGLMLEPESGMIHDYVNGIPDIQSRKMRVIGDPEARYQEDPVRMLRILRLAAKLQCTVADSSLQPIASNADILANIVPARLLEEVIKLVHCKYSRNGFELCRTHNLLAQLFPNTKHYSDAQWKFCEQALANNDRAMHEGKQISLSLVCSALYWPMISQSWQDTACHNRRSNVMKMRQYYDKSGVLTNPILSRIIRARIWEIWEYQARFHGLYKRRKALTIRPNYAVSKGLEFLRLRHHFDEVPEEKIQWWQTFISANKQQREDMVPSKKSTNKTSKKPKRFQNMAKLLLAIDCSFGGHSVALVNDDQLLASCHHPRIFATEAIIASIDKILRRARYKLTDIRALAYGAGPGLFSGIRAACVTVQGIAFAMRLLIARVPTTLALAQLYQCDQALVAYPAYLKHFYMAAYVRSNALWHTKLEPSLVHVKRIPVLKGDWQLCSRRRSKLRVNLNRCVTGKLQYLPANQASIAPAVAQLGMRLWQSDQLLKPELALPLYVRHKVAFTRQERIANNA